MEQLIAYSIGVCTASCCVDKNLTKKQVEKIMNQKVPTGIGSGWKISKDEKFRSGEANPCPCEEHPNKRLHYLMNC